MIVHHQDGPGPHPTGGHQDGLLHHRQDEVLHDHHVGPLGLDGTNRRLDHPSVGCQSTSPGRRGQDRHGQAVQL